MPDSQVFSGNWTIEVLSKDAAFDERFVIEGSVSSDGAYPGLTTTPPVSVSGAHWTLRFEWNNNAGSGWQPSDIRRVAASYTLQEGLVTVLGADDNLPEFRDHDFNDLVLRCRNRDPDVNPRIPLANLPQFTLPKDVWNGGVGNSCRPHCHPARGDKSNSRDSCHDDGGKSQHEAK